MKIKSILQHRAAGVLLHPSSLPNDLLNGDIGHSAYRFIEFLHRYGFKVWQVLPLGPTMEDKSPYQSYSANAGNADLISLDWLVDQNWLEFAKINSKKTSNNYRRDCLKHAAQVFFSQKDEHWQSRFAEFCQQQTSWLDDYALFMACKQKYQQKAWFQWPTAIRHRQSQAIKKHQQELNNEINYHLFVQFVFFTQWLEIKDYAHQHDIKIYGDIPIFVGLDSVDVWAERENFLLDADGNMKFVAGVPPDAFSDEGQRWGNPLYDWEYMQKNHFDWWKKRFQLQHTLFDYIRIDHFRGLQACWHIPAADETAINGRWIEVPGDKLLQVLYDEFSELPLIAENLGIITHQVVALQQQFNLPGMRVLQFAFDGDPANYHLPHRYEKNDVVYTGTHDNDTTLGWLKTEENYHIDYFSQYMNLANQTKQQQLQQIIRCVMASVCKLAIVPMQDLLKLDSTARMNTPGTTEDNWQWRFDWEQLDNNFCEQIANYISIYQR